MQLKILNIEKIMYWCLQQAEKFYGYGEYKKDFEKVSSDLSQQYTEKIVLTPFFELKLRNQHCFQALFTEKFIRKIKRGGGYLRMVDIGDSAGNHIKYLKHLLREKYEIDGTSVNLDKTAVDKINASGGKAVLCRAEEYNPGNVDFYLSYEMVEHLHNPALFLHRLAKADKGKHMVITVPYLRQSRVALHNSMNKSRKPITAEQEHIFELSPKDWEKLCIHAGWKVVESEIYFQYPTNIPIISNICRSVWKKYDYEGFLGLALKRDMSVSKRYLDWEE